MSKTSTKSKPKPKAKAKPQAKPATIGPTTVDCWNKSGLIGPHKLTLDPPIRDGSLGTCELCQEPYRVKAGPPPSVVRA
jgi:hypothetical protein